MGIPSEDMETSVGKEVIHKHNDDNSSQVSKLSCDADDDDATFEGNTSTATGKTASSGRGEARGDKDLVQGRSRKIVIALLAIGGAVCATVTYLFTSGHQKNDFETQV